jgi:hypothetical protein
MERISGADSNAWSIFTVETLRQMYEKRSKIRIFAFYKLLDIQPPET